jgi:polysaccharide biosynthesis protein PslH
MKILMIASYLPYPLIDGGKIRLYNLLKLLSQKHEITLICEKRPNQTQKDIEEIEKSCKKVIVFERPKAWSMRNVAKSTLTLEPLLTTVHTHKDLKKLIKKELDEYSFDLIHIETFYVMQNLPKVSIPIVLVEHNIEYSVYEKYAKKASVFLRPVLYLDVFKLKRAEKKYWKRADQLVAVSYKEQKIMGKNTKLVPNGVDLDKFRFEKKDRKTTEKKILFIGNFKWVQNRDSTAFIIRNIWPILFNKNKNLKLWIVGKEIPSSLKSLATTSIIFDENAPEETEKIFHESDMLLTPIRIGGGSNFKILEAMATGTPVVTSRLGNEGIEARNNLELLICEKPEEYVDCVLKLTSDDYLFEKIARNGRKFVEENYDWKQISLKLDSVYKEALK